MDFKYFDTHCHLNRPEFDSDLKQVVARADAAGVGMLLAATCVETSRKCVEVASSFDSVFAAVGVHPNDATPAEISTFPALRELASDPKVIALGETGLDYYRDRAEVADQKKLLEMHFELALELNLPVLLHARSSEDDMLDMAAKFCEAGGKAVWHCFVSGKKQLRQRLDRALEMGMYLGLGGMITFEDQKPLREIVPEIPDRHLLLETDCPFLAPRPRDPDDRRNEPARIVRICEELAALRKVAPEDIARITTRNAFRLLGLERNGQPEEEKYAYIIRNSMYLGLTNRCNNNCTFCARNNSYVVKGHDISLDHEPAVDEVIRAMGDISRYGEIVFCGFGETTLRFEDMKTVAAYCKERGQTVRLNTNGMGSLENGRDIVPEMVGLVDVISVSLNTADPAQYNELCRPRFGEQAYDGMCDFIRRSAAAGIKTICTVVDMPDIDVEAAREKTESLGAELRVRSFVDVG